MDAETVSHLEPRLRRLENDFDTFAKDTRSSLGVIRDSLTRMESNKPLGFIQIISGVLLISSMVGALVGGVLWVVSSASEPRLKLLEYQIQEMRNKYQTMEWKTK